MFTADDVKRYEKALALANRLTADEITRVARDIHVSKEAALETATLLGVITAAVAHLVEKARDNVAAGRSS